MMMIRRFGVNTARISATRHNNNYTQLRFIAETRRAVDDQIRPAPDHNNMVSDMNTFIDNTAPSLDLLDTTETFIDKRCFGVPFKIDEERAQELACMHHGTAVEIHSAERLMVPFWMATTSAGGHFKAEVLRQNPLAMRPIPVWDDVWPMQFSYPFDDYHIFNQVPACYDVPIDVLYNTCAGQHVPSMLISRFELLEELEEMKNAPRMFNFTMSVASATDILNTRVNRSLLDTYAKKDLKKFFPRGFLKANIRFMGIIFELVKIRPVFLPLYRLQVATISHTDFTMPTYVCGATGKTTGPVIHAQLRRKMLLGGSAGLVGLGVSAAAAGPIIGSAVGAVSSFAAVHARHARAVVAAKLEVKKEETKTAHTKAENAESDERGYKWKVEDEERYEFEHRESLREKARRRMRFEQRVQEEMAQDDAQAARARTETHKKHARRPRRERRPGQVELDPLGYYAVLGIKGEAIAKASKDSIAKAFRREAQQHHPDMVPEDKKEEAKSRMQKIVEAYNVLRDKKLRAEYDTGNMFDAKKSEE